MTKVFFIYVWGPPGNPAWPMTFASKAARMPLRFLPIQKNHSSPGRFLTPERGYG